MQSSKFKQLMYACFLKDLYIAFTILFFPNNINVSSWQQFGLRAETKEVRPRFYLIVFWRWRAHWRGVRNYS